MSDSNNNDDWEFSIEEPQSSESKEEKTPLKIISRKDELELENSTRRKVSRSQIAQEMDPSKKVKPRYIYASPIVRLKAAVVDVLAFSVLFGIVYGISAWQEELFKSFSEHIYRDFSLIYFNSASLVLMIAFYFLFFILPLSGSGKSPGKSFFGLTCSSDKMKKFGVIKALIRELVLKPIALISVVGVLTMFFTKKKKGLHDYILGTLVTKD